MARRSGLFCFHENLLGWHYCFATLVLMHLLLLLGRSTWWMWRPFRQQTVRQTHFNTPIVEPVLDISVLLFDNTPI